jgi:hypothetical protein
MVFLSVFTSLTRHTRTWISLRQKTLRTLDWSWSLIFRMYSAPCAPDWYWMYCPVRPHEIIQESIEDIWESWWNDSPKDECKVKLEAPEEEWWTGTELDLLWAYGFSGHVTVSDGSVGTGNMGVVFVWLDRSKIGSEHIGREEGVSSGRAEMGRGILCNDPSTNSGPRGLSHVNTQRSAVPSGEQMWEQLVFPRNTSTSTQCEMVYHNRITAELPRILPFFFFMNQESES